MRGYSIRKEIGYPDEMQAREAMIKAMYELGSWKAFCEAVGLSPRYVALIMEWLRPPTHWKLMQYFGWHAVYAVPEDLTEPKPPRQKPGRKPLTFLEKLERQSPTNQPEQRAYWRQKQRESRERRRLQQIRSI